MPWKFLLIRRISGLTCLPQTRNTNPEIVKVDYYNQGSSPGSVFQVAAQHNNVTYNRACCGLLQSKAYSLRTGGSLLMTMAGLGALALLVSY